MQIGEECWSPTLKEAMADELCNPAEGPDCEGDLVGWIWRDGGEVVEEGCSSDEDWSEENASNWLEKDVEDRVVCRSNGTKVELKVWHCEPVWKWNESWCVCCLTYVRRADVSFGSGGTDEKEGCKHNHWDTEHMDCDIDRMLMV